MRSPFDWLTTSGTESRETEMRNEKHIKNNDTMLPAAAAAAASARFYSEPLRPSSPKQTKRWDKIWKKCVQPNDRKHFIYFFVDATLFLRAACSNFETTTSTICRVYSRNTAGSLEVSDVSRFSVRFLDRFNERPNRCDGIFTTMTRRRKNFNENPPQLNSLGLKINRLLSGFIFIRKIFFVYFGHHLNFFLFSFLIVFTKRSRGTEKH